MTDLEQQGVWRTEFEAVGERAAQDTIYHGPGIYTDPKRLFALRWLRGRVVLSGSAKERDVLPRPLDIWGSGCRSDRGVVGVLVTWFAR